MKRKIFRFSLVYLIIILFGLTYRPTILMATNADRCQVLKETLQDKKAVKAYLTESLGGGCEVYHVVKCFKTIATAPITCLQANWEQYRDQCEAPPPTANEDIEGRLPYKAYVFVKDCLVSNQNQGPMPESACKGRNGTSQYHFGTVFGAWKCPESGFGCPQEDIQVIAKVPADNNQQASEILAIYPELQGKVKDRDYMVTPMYRIGTSNDNNPSNATEACLEGDFAALDTGDVVFGSLMAGSLPDVPAELEGECKSVNATPVSDKPAVTCSKVQIIASSSGTGLLSEFIGAIYQWAASIIGIIAVLVMVVSGIQISMAGGDSAKVDSAKTRIMESIVGLTILFLAGLILYTINPNFFITG